MVFDKEKFKAIHFSQKKKFTNSDILLSDNPLLNALGERQLVKPISKIAAIYWLRVFFDTKFSFKNHVTKLANKAQ